MIGNVHILDEPSLEFRYGQRMQDPRDGLTLFGPCDADESSHPKSLAYGVVGPPDGIALVNRWSAAMNQAWTQAPKDRVRLWPPFPGFEAAFSTTWHPEPAWMQNIDRELLLDASRRRDSSERAYAVVNLYLDAFKASEKLDERLAVMICVIPDEVYQNCRPESYVTNATGEKVSAEQRASRRAGQLEMFTSFDREQYELSVDFRRQLKARSMRYRVPLQIVRESTLKVSDDFALGERGLTPLSNRMWNLATALYYKGGGKPWRLATARDGVCYVGIAFRRAEGKHGHKTACCAAQMFLNSGDGIVFLGQYGPWYSPVERQFHLSPTAATSLLKGVLDTYAELHGKPLTEVFLHSRSDISREEYDGYREACPNGTRVVGVRVRTSRFGPRLYRFGKMPVLRGTLWEMSPRTGYLFASGFKPRLGTYDGCPSASRLGVSSQRAVSPVGECRPPQRKRASRSAFSWSSFLRQQKSPCDPTTAWAKLK
jgi:hypothetical protein